jgi:hypothetical protein
MKFIVCRRDKGWSWIPGLPEEPLEDKIPDEPLED